MPDGREQSDFPFEGHESLEPVYEEVPGWNTITAGIDSYGKLPQGLLDYLSRIESLVGAPVSIISTGPRREESILLNPERFWKS